MKAIFAAWLLAAASLHAEAVIEASGELPASARDQHGDTVGGIGSGLVYDPKTDLYFTIADRGPGDGTLPYRPRYVKLRIKQDGEKLNVKVVESVLFRDEVGREMTGLIPTDLVASVPRMADGRTCLDPEAIALAKDGTLYVTDEYGPFLYQFRQDGRMIRRITLPAAFHPREDQNRLNFTPDAKLTSGRNINQGPEGMSLLPNQKRVVLAFQSGLVQHGGRHSPNTNLLILDLASGKPVAQYAYPFENHLPGTKKRLDLQRLSVNDIVALSDTRFLVLERDGSGRDGAKNPSPAKYKSVWAIDTSKATNLLKPSDAPPVPVAKSLLFNLPALVSNPATLSAKWEGIALIPPVKSGEVTIMMTADNDFLNPVIYEEGKQYPFPRAKDAVPSQFFKIRADLPEKP